MSKELDPYQFIQPEYSHKNMVTISEENDAYKITDHIADEMTHFSWEATDALEIFVRSLFIELGPVGAVVVKRTTNDKRIILDIHVLWGSYALETEDEVVAEAQRLTARHQKLCCHLMLPVESVLHFIAPTKYRTVEQLQAAIPRKMQDNQKLSVLGSIQTLQKSTSAILNIPSIAK